MVMVTHGDPVTRDPVTHGDPVTMVTHDPRPMVMGKG